MRQLIRAMDVMANLGYFLCHNEMFANFEF